MKKIKFVLFACLLMFGVKASAQFRSKEKVIHLGIGTNQFYFQKGFPFTAAFEYGFSKWVSGGAGLDLIPGNVTQGYYSYTYIGVCPAARFSVHLAQIDVRWLDLYFGATGGANQFITSVNQSDRPSAIKDRSYFAAYFGAHFNIKKAFGLFAEASAGTGLTSNARIGIALTVGGEEE